jgi:hypothetical protein
MSGGSLLTEQTHKQVYIDAKLLFEISYPEKWTRIQAPTTMRPLAEETVTWHFDHKNNKNTPANFSILSLAKERNRDGYNSLEKRLIEQIGNLKITERRLMTLPVGQVQKFSGTTAGETFAIWLYLGKVRHYIIKCSASTAVFEQYRPMFIQIADSFMAIKQQ